MRILNKINNTQDLSHISTLRYNSLYKRGVHSCVHWITTQKCRSVHPVVHHTPQKCPLRCPHYYNSYYRYTVIVSIKNLKEIYNGFTVIYNFFSFHNKIYKGNIWS